MWLFVVLVPQLFAFINAESMPTISLNSIEVNEINSESLKDSGGKIGAFVVDQMGSEYQQAFGTFLEKAPECLKNRDFPNLEMNDGSYRTTYAVDKEDQPLLCLEREIEIIDKHFDTIDNFVAKVVEAESGPANYQAGNQTLRYGTFSIK